jgi:hypothetical protein
MLPALKAPTCRRKPEFSCRDIIMVSVKNSKYFLCRTDNQRTTIKTTSFMVIIICNPTLIYYFRHLTYKKPDSGLTNKIIF